MSQNLKETKTIRTPSAAPYYFAAFTWFILSFVFPMYKLSSLLICAGASVLAALVGKKMYPDKVEIIEVIKEEQYASEAIRITVEEGVRLIDELEEVNRKIEHPVISNQIDTIVSIAKDILNTIKEKPGSVGSMRKFMNYYLPTTLKLLSQYSNLEKQNYQVENVQESMNRIEKMMNLIVEAFKKQLDNLFEGEALDISSEITVMEQMMASEGLIEKDHPLKGGMN